MGTETDRNDDIRSTLASAFAGELGGERSPPATIESDAAADAASEGAPQQTTTAQEPPAGDNRQRDELGRFKPGEQAAKSPVQRETLTIKPKTDETAQPPAKGTEPPKAAQTPKELADELQHGAEPPIEWKGQAKIDFKRLPPAVQASIRETMDGIATANADIAPLKELIDVNRQMLVNEAGSVPEGFRQLLAMHKLSLERPVDLCAYILQRRGIDPAKAFSGQSPSQTDTPRPDADINSLVQQAVQQAVQPLMAQQQQTESLQYRSQIQAFAADAAAHPYFNDVKDHMVALLRGGQAQNLKEAYDQAVWANPSIRQQLLASNAEDAARAKAAEVERAQQAARASTSGSPAPGTTTAPAMGGSDGSIRGDLMAAFNARTGAV